MVRGGGVERWLAAALLGAGERGGVWVVGMRLMGYWGVGVVGGGLGAECGFLGLLRRGIILFMLSGCTVLVCVGGEALVALKFGNFRGQLGKILTRWYWHDSARAIRRMLTSVWRRYFASQS